MNGESSSQPTSIIGIHTVLNTAHMSHEKYICRAVNLLEAFLNSINISPVCLGFISDDVRLELQFVCCRTQNSNWPAGDFELPP